MQTACPYHTPEIHKAISARTFVAELKSQLRLIDLLALLAVPLFLFAAQLLPAAARRELALVYERPTLVSMLTAHFVHATWGHLFSNLGSYTLVTLTAYVLSVLTDRRRQFFIVFVAILTVVPMGLSLVIVQLRSTGIAWGFSGIVMALVGYLLLIQVGYFALRFSPAAHLDHAPGIFFFGIAAIVLITSPLTRTTGLIVSGVILIGLFYLWPVLRASSISGVFAGVQRAGYFEVALFGTITSGWMILTTFSARAGTTTVIIDQTSHLFGFTAGFLLAYIALRTDCSFAHVCHCARPDSDCKLHASWLTRCLRWVLVWIGYC
ncbi:MAG: hypothetical protein ABEH65_12200 [Halobacteriales archaeon]